MCSVPLALGVDRLPLFLVTSAGVGDMLPSASARRRASRAAAQAAVVLIVCLAQRHEEACAPHLLVSPLPLKGP